MRIGIVAQEHDEIFGVHRDYLNLVETFGTPIVISPVDPGDLLRTFANLDGLVLPGGSDVNPRRYGAMFSFMSYRPNSYLEYFDTELLRIFIEARIPIFGICRGLQTLNVHFGGTLYQHLWKHPHSKDKEDLVHKIFIDGLPDVEFQFKVNSFHHQSINGLGKGLRISAKSDDGIIEAIAHDSFPIIAVQWHPERIHDDFSLGLMGSLFS